MDLDCPLLSENNRLTLTDAGPGEHTSLDEHAADHAAQRLVETLALGTRLVDGPLYRLLNIDAKKGQIIDEVGASHPFVRYALTMDLLEGELSDTVAAGTAVRRGGLPLRDRYLPDAESVLMSHNGCARAGPCLVHDRASGGAAWSSGYLLIMQERSGHVLNAAQTLAVIPKGFHEPLADYRADAQVGSTLVREMEEELFGRDDVDSTVADQRCLDPMHPSRLPGPMRWLTGVPGALRIECTGFGLNLVN